MLISLTALQPRTSWQNQAALSGVFHPVTSITLLLSRAGNTTHATPKNNIYCKLVIQGNKCMNQQSNRECVVSKIIDLFVCIWWGLWCIYPLAENDWYAGPSDRSSDYHYVTINFGRKVCNFRLARNDVRMTQLCLLCTNYLCKVSTKTCVYLLYKYEENLQRLHM